MPAHELHLTADMLILGKTYPEVHQFLDQFQPYLQSKHREYLHDENAVNTVWEVTGDQYAAMSAYLHIILDQLSDIVGKDKCIAVLIEMLNRGQLFI